MGVAAGKGGDPYAQYLDSDKIKNINGNFYYYMERHEQKLPEDVQAQFEQIFTENIPKAPPKEAKATKTSKT